MYHPTEDSACNISSSIPSLCSWTLFKCIHPPEGKDNEEQRPGKRSAQKRRASVCQTMRFYSVLFYLVLNFADCSLQDDSWIINWRRDTWQTPRPVLRCTVTEIALEAGKALSQNGLSQGKTWTGGATIGTLQPSATAECVTEHQRCTERCQQVFWKFLNAFLHPTKTVGLFHQHKAGRIVGLIVPFHPVVKLRMSGVVHPCPLCTFIK
jgi:hypothetical protein